MDKKEVTQKARDAILNIVKGELAKRQGSILTQQVIESLSDNISESLTDYFYYITNADV